MSETSLDEFAQTYNLESIVNKPTCYKSNMHRRDTD